MQKCDIQKRVRESGASRNATCKNYFVQITSIMKKIYFTLTWIIYILYEVSTLCLMKIPLMKLHTRGGRTQTGQT